MQLPILAVFACLVAWVAADGVRNGYERVWLWYAYRLTLRSLRRNEKLATNASDGMKQPNHALLHINGRERTVCLTSAHKSSGKPYGPPLPNTALCKGKAPGGSCYFWELMQHIDGKTYIPKLMWLLPTTDTNDLEQQKNLKPDPKATAEWLSVEHGNTPLEKTYNPPRAISYSPWKVWQGVGDIFNDMLLAVGEHSAATVAGLSADQRVTYKDQLDGMKLALRSTIIEREIDHSRFVIEQADAKGFTLAKRTELGYTGDIVDWDGTKVLHKTDDYNKFYKDFYHLPASAETPENSPAFKASKIAREHLQVMRDFRTIEAGILPCGV